MSYISFYRKWRPQAFSEVIGQEHIVKTLQNAISRNRLVHGYMFCGPKGTGKTSIARIFAKAINCANGPAVEPCNKCDNCISITAGSNVDFIEIDGASNNGVNDIRILREKVTSLPFILRKKIYIIDEVHMLSPSAFNALLKTLEEPPEHVIFMMATTNPQDVIQTIMSRCQRFDFGPISLDKTRARIKDIASIENIDITDSAISMVAKYSDGSLRDADGILEQLSSFSDGKITVDEVSSILGIIDQDMLFELANIILEKNISQGLLFVSRLFSTSFSLNAFVSEFLEHLYILYVIKNYENPADILDMPDDFKDNYFNQAGLFTARQIENLIYLFSDLLAQIKESENPKTFFKAAIIKALNIEISEIAGQVKTADMPGQGKTHVDEHAFSGEAGKNAADVKLPKNTAEMGITASAPDKVISKDTAENPSGREMAKSIADKVITKTASTADKGMILPDKAAAQESVEKISGKEPVKETAQKKAHARQEEEQPLMFKQLPPESILIVENSAAIKPGIESALDLPQDLKKSPDDFSHLILEIWPTLLMKTKEKKVFLEAKLKEVKRFRVQGKKLFLLLEPKNNWHKTELNKTENKELIQELLKSLAGEKFDIVFDFISDENISESIDIAHQAGKTRTSDDFSSKNKEHFDPETGLLNESGAETDALRNTAGSKKSLNGKDSIVSIDAYGYFEEKFKVKEK